MKLKDTIKILAGYQIRGRIIPVQNGNARIIQMKDVDIVDGIHFEALSQVDINAKESNWLKQGHLLFVARGYQNYAVLVDRPEPNIVAAPQFFVLKPDPKVVHPGYLHWHINSFRTQRYFKKMAQSTSLPTITRNILEEVPFALPPIPEQEKIAEIYLLLRQEQQINRQIQEKRRIVVEAVMEEVLNKE